MHTARLPAIRVSVATTRCHYQLGRSSSERVWTVSSDDYQMSVAGGGGRCPGLMGGTPPCDLSHDACDVPTPTPTPIQPLWTEWLVDGHLWKHYLPATSLAGGKKCAKYSLPNGSDITSVAESCEVWGIKILPCWRGIFVKMQIAYHTIHKHWKLRQLQLNIVAFGWTQTNDVVIDKKSLK